MTAGELEVACECGFLIPLGADPGKALEEYSRTGLETVARFECPRCRRAYCGIAGPLGFVCFRLTPEAEQVIDDITRRGAET